MGLFGETLKEKEDRLEREMLFGLLVYAVSCSPKLMERYEEQIIGERQGMMLDESVLAKTGQTKEEVELRLKLMKKTLSKIKELQAD